MEGLPERFEILDRVGQGGMATVYLARDHTTSSDVALKVLLPHLRSDPAVAQRFRREVSVARRVVHPNVIRIYDLLEGEDLLALVLEYHPGIDAKQLLRQSGGRLEYELAMDLIEQALEGLIAAHDAGIIHRDIKPHNLLVADVDGGPRVKLADFGLARVDDLIGMTMHTRAIGTLEYMAPEQFDSHMIDHRADLYGLGVTLYELLCGELPFRAHTPLALAELHQRARRPNIREKAPHVPEHVALTIQRAMASDPSARFSTAREMLAALRGEQPVLARAEEALCVRCQAPLLRRLDTCLECGHTNQRMIRRPGQGNKSLLIHAGNRRALLDTEQEALVGLLREDETTAPYLKVDWNVGQVPAIVANHLTDDDAARLGERLTERGLHHETLGTSAADKLRLLWKMRPPLLNTIGVFAIGTVFLCGMGGFFMLLDGEWAGAFNALAPMAIFTFVVFVASLIRANSSILKYKKTSGEELEHGQEFEHTLSMGYLPDETAELIRRLSGRRTRELIKKILGVALELHARLEDHPDETGLTEQALEHLLARTTEVARNLVELEEELNSIDAQAILEEIRALDDAIAAEESTLEVGDLIEQKAALHVTLGRIDEAQRELSLQSSKLLHIHAELEQLLIDIQDMDQVIFSQENQVSVILQGLAEQLDATLEAEAAVEVGAFPDLGRMA